MVSAVESPRVKILGDLQREGQAFGLGHGKTVEGDGIIAILSVSTDCFPRFPKDVY